MTTVRLTGRNANGDVLYGPAEQPVATQNIFPGVNILVTSVTVDYLANAQVVGTLVTPVTLVANTDFVINDPNFQDAPPVATSVTFQKAPSAGLITGSTFAPILVQVRDQFGNPFTTATTVTASLVAPQGATLGGTLQRNTVNGVATFNDLTISQAGTFQIQFNVDGIAPRVAAVTVGDLAAVANANPSLGHWFIRVGNAYTELWDFNNSFSLSDGRDDSFDTVHRLRVGGVNYPSDQTYGALTFLTPLITQAQGLLAPGLNSPFGPVRQGNFAGEIFPAQAATLSTSVDLTNAVAPVTLTWVQDYDLDTLFPGQANQSYKVVLRDANNNQVGGDLFAQNGSGSADNDMQNVDLSAFVGQNLTLSFEAAFAGNSSDGDLQDFVTIRVDAVSVVDNNATQFVTNGDFETGDLAGWTSNVSDQSQNMRSAVRTVNNLDVVRTVYARPDQRWVRYFDQFTNNTGAPITVTIDYDGNTGHDLGANPRVVPGSQNRAWSSFDSQDSDLACVFGNMTLSANSSTNGQDDIDFQTDVTVQPGQTVALVAFYVQSGERSTAPPVLAEQIALDILAGFRNDPLFTDGLTAAELAQIVNL